MEIPILSTADIAASERFDIMVSVIKPDGSVESSSKKRKGELEEIIEGIIWEEDSPNPTLGED